MRVGGMIAKTSSSFRKSCTVPCGPYSSASEMASLSPLSQLDVRGENELLTGNAVSCNSVLGSVLILAVATDVDIKDK